MLRKKYNELTKLLNSYGKQLDIHGNNSYDLLELADKYIELSYHEFEFIIEGIETNQFIDLKRVIAFLNDKISLATLEYRLFGVKPQSYSKEENDITDLMVYDLLNPMIVGCHSCGIHEYSSDGKFLHYYKNVKEAMDNTNVTRQGIMNVIGKPVTVSGRYFRFSI